MLIRSQSGERILHAHSVMLYYYDPTDQWSLLATDQFDPEGVVVAVYATAADAQAALDYVFHTAGKGESIDLSGAAVAMYANCRHLTK